MFISFSRRVALGGKLILKAILLIPLTNHLAIGIFYYRRECCNSGIPFRPSLNDTPILDSSNVEDWTTRSLYWGLFIVCLASKSHFNHTCIIAITFCVCQIHLGLAVLWSIKINQSWKSRSWTKTKKKQRNPCFENVITIISLGLWTALGSFICLHYLLVDPSSEQYEVPKFIDMYLYSVCIGKAMIFVNQYQYHDSYELPILDVGTTRSPTCYSIRFNMSATGTFNDSEIRYFSSVSQKLPGDQGSFTKFMFMIDRSFSFLSQTPMGHSCALHSGLQIK